MLQQSPFAQAGSLAIQPRQIDRDLVQAGPDGQQQKEPNSIGMSEATAASEHLTMVFASGALLQLR